MKTKLPSDGRTHSDFFPFFLESEAFKKKNVSQFTHTSEYMSHYLQISSPRANPSLQKSFKSNWEYVPYSSDPYIQTVVCIWDPICQARKVTAMTL